MGFFSSIGNIAKGAFKALNPVGLITDSFGSILGAGADIYSTSKNYDMQKKQLKYQKSVDERNFANQDRAFEYQKFLNNNQIQIQASDAQKAGINPMAMQGGSLSSGSYSNVSSETQAPQLDLSGLMQAGLSIDRNRLDSRIARESNSNAREINQANIDSANYRAELAAHSQETQTLMKVMADKGMKADEIAESARQFNSSLQETKRHNVMTESLADKSLTETERHNLAEEQLRRVANDEMIQSRWSKDAQTNSFLSKQRELMDMQIENYKSAINQRKWERADMIMNQINNTARTIVGAVNPLVNFDSYMSSGSSNKIGF